MKHPLHADRLEKLTKRLWLESGRTDNINYYNFQVKVAKDALKDLNDEERKVVEAERVRDFEDRCEEKKEREAEGMLTPEQNME